MEVGEVVEDFELPDQTGAPRRLSALVTGGPIVLFFYPAAFSPTCTVEACRFRDMMAEFAAVGAQPVGISQDNRARQDKFAQRHHLGYPLLSDVDGRVGSKFDVNRDFSFPLTRTRRHTYIIGSDQRVLDVIRAEIRISAHADLALQFLKHYGYNGRHYT